MADSNDLPIALRRTRRNTNRLPTRHSISPAAFTVGVSLQNKIQTPVTPSRSQSLRHGTKKKVRFSDPGPVLSVADDDVVVAHGTAVVATGLTPMIQRTSLASVTPMSPSSSRRRRHSTPAAGRPLSAAMEDRSLPNMDAPSRPFSGDVTFLPLRQVLDGRVKRRLRRNGLSEEMNAIYTEKRRQAAAARAELERLRAEVAEKDAAIQRLQQQQNSPSKHAADNEVADGNTIVQDTARIMDLERQVAELHRELVTRTESFIPSTPEADHRSYNWTLAARDPFNSTMNDEGDNDNDDDNDVVNDGDGDFLDTHSPAFDCGGDMAFGDITMAELQSSTPSRPARAAGHPTCTTASGSFPTPPPTSPVLVDDTPVTPIRRCSVVDMMMSSSPLTNMVAINTPCQANAETQVLLPDAEKEKLQEELASLQREMDKLEASVAAHQSLMERLNAKLAKSGLTGGADKLEEHVAGLLRSLSDKTAALADLSAGLHGLGFGQGGGNDDENSDNSAGQSGLRGADHGADPSEVITTLAAAFRSARLELEYLTPGEITLPLTAAGAAVLDLVLARLRTLARRAREADDEIDEYHELERSLRQQLGARVAAMDDLTREVAVRDARIGELEAVVQSKEADAVAAAAAHDERVAELETGLDRLKSAMASYERDMAELEALVQQLEASLGEKQVAVNAMEMRLAAAIGEAETLRAGAAADHEAHGCALALHDARVAELRDEIDRVNADLQVAHDAACQLRLDNANLSGRLDANHNRSQTAVAALRAELARMVGQLSEQLLADGTASTPPVIVRTGPFAELKKHVHVDARSSVAEGRETSRKRRRYDSGLSFLEEEEDS